jgi:tRNA-2-methylthio-N6-dimethylallyladenosine synthase
MIRRYTKEEYVARAALLRAARPGLTLSTDIIIGFCGETETDFQETLDLVRAVGFAGLFGFKYSRRPYTPAQKLDDDVPEKTKSTRLAALFALAEELQRAKLEALVGSTERVLVEGQSKAGSNKVTGRTERNEIVHITDEHGTSLVGEIVEVKIVRSFKHSLEGEITPRWQALCRPGPAAPPRRRTLPLVAAES